MISLSFRDVTSPPKTFADHFRLFASPEDLDLSHNELTGEIPVSLAELSTLGMSCRGCI